MSRRERARQRGLTLSELVRRSAPEGTRTPLPANVTFGGAITDAWGGVA